MAKTFQKTYSLTVEYRYDDNKDITDADMNVAVLRGKIKESIAHCLPSGQGDLNVQLIGVVSET